MGDHDNYSGEVEGILNIIINVHDAIAAHCYVITMVGVSELFIAGETYSGRFGPKIFISCMHNVYKTHD